MNNLNKKPLLLIAAGLLAIAFLLIVQHYKTIPDFLSGAFFGVAIGGSFLGVSKLKRKVL